MKSAILIAVLGAALVGVKQAIASYRAHKSALDIAVDTVEAVVDKIDPKP